MKTIGIVTTTEIIFDNPLSDEFIKWLAEDLEETITQSIESRFNCTVVGGLGGFIYMDKDGNVHKPK